MSATAASPPPRILAADDQRDVLDALRLLLRPEGFQVDVASSPDGVMGAVLAHEFDVVLMDLNYARDTTSGAEGLDLLARLHAHDPDLPILVMTAWATVDLAVEAMRRGARDVVQKPWDNARLVAALGTQVELVRALRRTRRLEAENVLLRGDGVPEVVAASPAMRAVLERVARVAPSDANILLTGENGTGKSLLARLVHSTSRRAGNTFVTVDVGSLPGTLFESELFGHVRGAFTDARADRVGRFEVADGGTLFLDEIANLALPLQAKLLRVAETGEFERVGSSQARRADVRLVSATNADLDAAVAAGTFRQDLLFRLDTVEIRVPPLRERREDIPVLAARFLEKHRARYGSRAAGFEPGAIDRMLVYPWPGNVRELEHAVERALLLARGNLVAATDLPLDRAPAPAATALDDLALEDVERLLIQKALDRFGGNVSQAAQFLGLSRSAMYRRFKRHGL